MTHIKDDLYLDADERQFILKQYKGKNKEGEELYKYLGYYRFPHEALDKVVHHYIQKDVEAGAELKELSDRMKELKNYFMKKFNDI